MQHKRAVIFGIVLVMVCSLWGGCHSPVSETESQRCDSLCDLSYRWSYKNLDSAWTYARKAQVLAGADRDNQAQALNQLAFIRFMKMDFIGSRKLYLRANSVSNNLLYQLVSEIGLMRIYQRTSENADFYMCRNSAQRHINRIEEEKEDLNAHEQHVFQLALQEFHIVSAAYFLNLQQTKRAVSEMEAFIPDENLMKADTAQWLSINYLKSTFRFVSGRTNMEKNLHSFDALLYGLRISRENAYDYYTARYLQGLAILLNRPDVIETIRKERSLGLQIINNQQFPLATLPEHLAKESLTVAERYNDIYLKSVSWRVLAGCYFRQKRYLPALNALDSALSQVNRHYELHYKSIHTPHLLESFNPMDSVSVEKKWMSDPRILTVPEWIARIREQFSMVYSALGDKMRSDYNRNVYLDILEITRQDKETEARYMELQQESRQLNGLLCIVLVSILCALFLLFYFRKKWGRTHRLRILKLRKTLDLCRCITATMPEDVEAEDDLFRQLSSLSRERIAGLFGDVEIIKNPVTGEIKVVPETRLSKDEKIMLDVISCFMTWAFAQGKNIVLLGEKYRSVQEQLLASERKIFENKRENEVRRACVSLVNNVTPLIDRILHELSRLNDARIVEKEAVREERYEYIEELADQINGYNDLLTHWIQIRQGMFNLHIERFALKELFAIIGQRKRLFEREGKSLVIAPTDAIVRADKLLTLFMLNTLVENAFKYTHEGDTTTVSTTEGEGFVEIAVKDTGIGISQADCERILHSKIYDASSIGMSDGNGKEELRKKKGSGFGLMNCKGIIEKYRKTNALFNVCLFGIESTLGKGSRFFFRLPGGRLLKSVVFILCLSGILSACDSASSPRPSHIVWKSDDALLGKASSFADSVYYCNIAANYAKALEFADSARNCLNAYYLKEHPGSKELMKAYGEEDPVELKWFSQNFNTDYHVILDIRNESAVAALALQRWNLYKYNNTAYTSLFKLLGEDHRLGDYCRRMQRSSNNKIVVIGLFLFSSIVFIIAYYILYFRRRTWFLINLKQVLMINKNLLHTATEQHGTLAHLLKDLQQGMSEIAHVEELSVAVYNENSKKLNYFSTDRHQEHAQLYQQLKQSFEEEKTFVLQEGREFIVPLMVEWGTTRQCIGAWHVAFSKDEPNDSLDLFFTLVSQSFANYLFHAIVRVDRKKRELELVEDENRRAYREASRLYVQNRVLDNCLSAIKHETMFYPSRIRQLAVSVGRNRTDDVKEQVSISEMYELAAYYKKIYSLLTLNADRQLATSVFKSSTIKVRDLFQDVEKAYVRLAKNYNQGLRLTVGDGSDTSLCVKGDVQLLGFLLHCALKAALQHPAEGDLSLSAIAQPGFVRFILKDDRLFFKGCDLRLLFSPEGCDLKPADGVGTGTAYLICKQIIRDHAEYTANRGCRINAELLPEGGYIIWFTIPECKTNDEYEAI